jgi:hypothetical protein
MVIRSRDHRQDAGVPIRGHWFYIDDRDLNAQSTITLLVELSGIEVHAGGGGGLLFAASVGG